MKLFKNFKTKKQLRAEIERLKAVHERPPIIKTKQEEIQEVRANYFANIQTISMWDCLGIAKEQVAYKIFEQIIPFIEYTEENCLGGKIYKGKLRVVKKNEQ